MSTSFLQTDLEKDEVVHIGRLISDKIINKSFFNWSAEQILNELELSKTMLFKQQQRVVSFVCFRDLPEQLEIILLGTEPASQKFGCMTHLIEDMQKYASHQDKSIILEVHGENEPAIGFYRKMSFKELHRRNKYYSDGGAALIMVWKNTIK